MNTERLICFINPVSLAPVNDPRNHTNWHEQSNFNLPLHLPPNWIGAKQATAI